MSLTLPPRSIDISLADYMLYELVDVNNNLCADVIAQFPKLVALHARVGARPRIAAYVQSGKRCKAVNYYAAVWDNLPRPKQ